MKKEKTLLCNLKQGDTFTDWVGSDSGRVNKVVIKSKSSIGILYWDGIAKEIKIKDADFEVYKILN